MSHALHAGVAKSGEMEYATQKAAAFSVIFVETAATVSAKLVSTI